MRLWGPCALALALAAAAVGTAAPVHAAEGGAGEKGAPAATAAPRAEDTRTAAGRSEETRNAAGRAAFVPGGGNGRASADRRAGDRTPRPAAPQGPASDAARSVDTSAFLDRTVSRVDIAFEGDAAAGDDGEFRGLVEQYVRAGLPLTADAVRDAVARLVSSGLASRVAVEVEGGPDDGRVAVRFRIVRQVRVVGVAFRGEDALAHDALPTRVGAVSVGARLTQPAVEHGADEVIRYYQERGFFEARVTPSTELDATGTRATVVYTVEPGAQARVSSFEIVGAVAIPQPQLREGLQLAAPGALYSRTALDADVERIRRAHLDAGYLSPEIREPEVERNPAANTVSVRVTVNSGPRVTVSVQGVDFKEKELKALLPVYTEGGIDEFALSEGTRRIEEELQRRGYFFARVSYELKRGPNPSDPVTVVYTADQGRRYRVTDIDVITTEGAEPEGLAFADLQPDLRSQEAGFLSRGLTSRELLQRDSTTIERRLKSIGYRKAVVRERRLGVSPDSDSLVITFVVETGPRARVAEIALSGNRVFSTDELLASRKLKPGDYYSDELIAADAGTILGRYAADGYVSTEASTQVVDLDQERVRLVYEITEGAKARINQVVINGNRRTSQATLLRYFTFKEGDVLRVDDLRRTEQTLYETGAFQQVIIHSEVTGPTEDGLGENRTVYVEIEEGRPWVLTYGGGFNTDDGARGLVELSNVNLFGRLNRGSIRLRASQREQLGQISYTNPIPFGLDLPMLVLVSYEREIKDAFGTNRFNTLLQFQKRLGEQSALSFRYNFQEVRLFDLQLSERELMRNDRPVRLGLLATSYYRDGRDNPFDPQTGQFVSGDFSVAAKAFGGNAQFVRLFGEYQRYYGVPKLTDVVYAGVVKFGLADPFGGERRLPISERFFSGGARTLRGFGFEQAGPRDKVTNNPIGGNALFVVNNEIRFPLFWRFGGAVFSDTGNVFRRLRDIDFAKMTETVGVGLSLKTPVGPIRVDLGYLLNRPNGVPATAIHFNFGSAF